jgi:hypothetical protein
MYTLSRCLLLATSAVVLPVASHSQPGSGEISIEKLGFVYVAKIDSDDVDRRISGARYHDYYIRVIEPRKSAELLSVQMPGTPKFPQFMLASYLVDCDKGATRWTFSQQFDALWSPKSEKTELKGTRWEIPVPKSLPSLVRDFACA